jgi:hypothetical protein
VSRVKVGWLLVAEEEEEEEGVVGVTRNQDTRFSSKAVTSQLIRACREGRYCRYRKVLESPLSILVTI